MFSNDIFRYFINIGKKITESIQKYRIWYENYTSLNNTKQNNYYVHEFKLDYNIFPVYEFKNVFKKLQNGASPVFDGISSDLLVQMAEYIVKLVTYLANISILKSIFPDIQIIVTNI